MKFEKENTETLILYLLEMKLVKQQSTYKALLLQSLEKCTMKREEKPGVRMVPVADQDCVYFCKYRTGKETVC